MSSTISRRQILSRSRDAGMDAIQKFAPYEDYEEMWFSHDHLFKDHISEVLRKWEQIDDEIWAKMIFMSRNRRIAKAYVRVPAVIINGSEDGFDGYRVGLNGFEDPFRDAQTEKLMNYIDECRIGIDSNGNIIIKRYSTKSGVYVRSYPSDFSESCVSNQVIKSNGSLEINKPYVIFDMRKFEAAMAEEMKASYPDRRRLEHRCIVVVAFGRNHPSSILELPIYVMLINIVALDLLKSKLNPVIYQSISQPTRTTTSSGDNQSRNGSRQMNGTIMTPSSNGQRVIGRNERLRIPDFVSIFHQQPQHSNESDLDDDEEEDTIYGRVEEHSSGPSEPRGGGCSDDYISDYEYRRFGPGFSRFGPYGSRQQSSTNNRYPMMSTTMRTNRPSPPMAPPPLPSLPPLPSTPNTINHYKSSTPYHTHDDRSSSQDSEPPPKLPPRDKKKLSKQINTIKKSRHQEISSNYQCEEDPYTIEIPSPDYHHQSSPDLNHESRRKSWSPFKSRPKADHDPNMSTMNRDHIYDTMNRSRSMVVHQGTKTNSKKSVNAQNMKMTASTIHIPINKANNNNLKYRAQYPGDDEDPYYSGLEARITSKKHLDQSSSHSKNKGLHWMMRKVLSSNYINILTSKRHKSKKVNGKNSKLSSLQGDSSTDSDPYVSINEVYEPIYGYTGNVNSNRQQYNHLVNPYWPTMQRISKKH